MTGSTGISASTRASSASRFPKRCGGSTASAASGATARRRSAWADFLRADDDAMLDTARHEYAHVAAALLTGRRHGHDAVWKDICVRIGCKPERLAGTTAAQEAKNAGCGYLVRCKTCGAESRYLRPRRGRAEHCARGGRIAAAAAAAGGHLRWKG